MIGGILNQRYRIYTLRGQGGMGTVYRGHDLLLDRDVAIKVVSSIGLGTAGRSRLLNEARAIASLNHPNIVNVYDAGEAEGAPFVVIEYVEGASLHDVPPRTTDEIISVTRQVCAALEHAHAHGIIHRDLKPENVIVSPDGRARLMDFGMARSVASRLTSEGTIVGTAFYLAPEQALGKEVDERTDLYALGVMLYELTTGRLPFTGEDALAVISQHLYAPVVPPRAHKSDIPPAFDALILRLMSKDPMDRPQTARQVMQALDDLEKPGAIEEAIPPEERALERIARGKLVGREHELGDMLAAWRRISALSGDGRVLLVSGEPGIGKTRLVRELMTQVQVAGARVLMGECYAEGGVPYAPVASLIYQGIACLEAGNGRSPVLPDRVLADLITLAPELRMRYPMIPPNPSLDPQTEQQRTYESVLALLSAVSALAPTMAILDDVHWADSGTLYLLRHLARRSRAANLRLLLVAMYREVELDEALPWHEVLLDLTRERLATRVKLGRLTREQTRDLLYALFEEEITPEFLDGIYKETEGNPFFVEEVCKTLVEEGKLYFKDGSWQRPPMTEIIVPQSVRIAIQARVAKLSEPAQEILRLASILGREFDFQVIRQASDWDEDTLISALEEAGHAQFISEMRSDQPGQVKFVFVHALIPATLSDSISSLRRQRMHRRVAQVIERLLPDDYESLANHFKQAGDLEPARVYFGKAGERALKVYANQEAERYFRTALEIGGSDVERADLLFKLGEAEFRQSHFSEARETWLEAISAYKTLGDYDGIARAYARASQAARQGGNQAEAVKLARQGLEAIEGQPETKGTATLLRTAANMSFSAGIPEEGESLLKRALGIAERFQSDEEKAEILSDLGFLLSYRKRFDEARQAFSQAIRLAESSGGLSAAECAHNYLGQLLIDTGELRESIDHFLHSAEICRKIGSPSRELFNLSLAMASTCLLGEFAPARAMRERLELLLQMTGSTGPPGHVATLSLSILSFFQGEWEEAINLLSEMRARARAQGDLNYLNIADGALGEVFLEMGELEQAVPVLTEAIAAGDRVYGRDIASRGILVTALVQQARIDEAARVIAEVRHQAREELSLQDRVHLDYAEVQLAIAERRWHEAWSAVEHSLGYLDEVGLRWYKAKMLRAWAEAYLRRDQPGDRERARQILEEALAICREMDVPKYASLVQSQLDALG